MRQGGAAQAHIPPANTPQSKPPPVHQQPQPNITAPPIAPPFAPAGKGKSLFGGLGAGLSNLLGGRGGGPGGLLGGLGGFGGGLKGLTGMFDHLPFGLDLGDILLFLLLLFFFLESGDEEFLIILAVIAFSFFKER